MKKMNHRTAFFVWVILPVIAMLMVGCTTGTSKPSKFYMLSSVPESESDASRAPESGAISVLIGPVTLPAYLDRAQVVTLTGKHELVVDEFTRWAEPLQDNFYRVLAENLSLLLNTPKIFAYDRRGTMPADFQIIIDVTRFDSVANGDAHLTVFWQVADKRSKAPSMTRKSVLRAGASSTGTTGIVDAQNRTLTEFSGEIAAAVRSLVR